MVLVTLIFIELPSTNEMLSDSPYFKEEEFQFGGINIMRLVILWGVLVMIVNLISIALR